MTGTGHRWHHHAQRRPRRAVYRAPAARSRQRLRAVPQQTFNGVRYLDGWITNPAGFASVRVGARASAGVSLDRAPVPLPAGPNPEHGAWGIIDERTGALIFSPPLTNLVSVTVPGLGTFPDHPLPPMAAGNPAKIRPAR